MPEELYTGQNWGDENPAYPDSAARQLHQEDGLEKVQEQAQLRVKISDLGVTAGSAPSSEKPLKIIGTPVAGYRLVALSATTAEWKPSSEAPTPSVERVGNYVLTHADAGQVQEFNSATELKLKVPNTLTAGDLFMVYQTAGGKVEVVGEAGVTVISPTGVTAKTRVQGSSIGIRMKTATVAVLSGDLE